SLICVVALALTDYTFTYFYKRRPGPAQRIRITSPVYHHDLAAFVENAPEVWGPRRLLYTTNSLGFRDESPRQISPAPKGNRLVFMGDSFVEGMGIAWEDSFVGLVAAGL